MNQESNHNHSSRREAEHLSTAEMQRLINEDTLPLKTYSDKGCQVNTIKRRSSLQQTDKQLFTDAMRLGCATLSIIKMFKRRN